MLLSKKLDYLEMARPDLLEQARQETLAILEVASGYFIHLMYVDDKLYCHLTCDSYAMPPFPFRNKSLQAKVESWQRLEGVSKRHEVERFDTKREMCERLFQLRVFSLPLISEKKNIFPWSRNFIARIVRPVGRSL